MWRIQKHEKKRPVHSVKTARFTSSFCPPAPKRARVTSIEAASPKLSRTNSTLRKQLGEGSRQSVGVGRHSWLQARLPGRATAISQTSHPSVCGRNPSGRRGSNCKRSNHTGARLRQQFCLNNFPCPKEGWPIQAGHQSETPEQICEDTALQDGGDARGTGSPPTGRLDDATGPERRLFCYPPLPAVKVASSHVRVPVPPFRSVFSPQNIRQNTTPSGGGPEATRDQMCDLSRRPLHNGTGSGGDSVANVGSNRRWVSWSISRSQWSDHHR